MQFLRPISISGSKTFYILDNPQIQLSNIYYEYAEEAEYITD